MTRLALLAAALLVAGCAGPAQRPAVASTPPAPSTAAPASSSAAPHLFVVVMENRGYAEAMAQPFTARLAAQYAVATNYHAVSHPSLPNYLALTAGSTFGITDDGYHPLPTGGIGAELTAHGVSWRAYMEGMTGGCLDSPAPYALKHNPFAYFGGCPANVVPLMALDRDLAGATPSFIWITPDLCHDGHDCSSRQADDFLAGLVPKILASAAWRDGGVLFLTWDEDDGRGGNRVPAIVVAPGLTRHETSRAHDHYSLLATVEDRLGVPRLGEARQADPLGELFG
jgi:phospholipase C